MKLFDINMIIFSKSVYINKYLSTRFEKNWNKTYYLFIF